MATRLPHFDSIRGLVPYVEGLGEGFIRFMAKRACRVYLPYFVVATASCTVLIGVLRAPWAPGGTAALALSYLFASNWLSSQLPVYLDVCHSGYDVCFFVVGASIDLPWQQDWLSAASVMPIFALPFGSGGLVDRWFPRPMALPEAA